MQMKTGQPNYPVVQDTRKPEDWGDPEYRDFFRRCINQDQPY